MQAAARISGKVPSARLDPLRRRAGPVLRVISVLLAFAGCSAPVRAEPHGCLSAMATPAEASVARLVQVRTGGDLAEGLELLRGMLAHAHGNPDSIGYVLDRTRALSQLETARNYQATATWFGHSSFLIRLAGVSLLIDPVFSNRLVDALPVFPRRLVPLPLEVEDLAAIDAILISHADQDHLDLPTLRRLHQRFPAATVLVPPGLGVFAKGVGFTRVRELAWFDGIAVGGVVVRAVPAQHASRRSMSDRGRCWTGFSLSAGGHRILFAGDTGYGPFYSRMREILGTHQVAFVPIGSSGEAAIREGLHVRPAEAVSIARDIGAKQAIAMHWGTFPLSPEPLREPAEEFRRAGDRQVETVVMQIGQTERLF